MTSVQAEKVELAELIAKALKYNEEQSSSSVQLFIEKIYKKSLGDQNKINQIRLIRFNSLLYKVSNQFHLLSSDDVEIIFTTLFCFMNKVGSFLKDKSIYTTYGERSKLLSITFHWTAKLIEAAANNKLGVEYASESLDWLLSSNKKSTPKLEEFYELTEKCSYFKKISLGLEEEHVAGSVERQETIIQQRDLSENIMLRINPRRLIAGFIENCNVMRDAFDQFVLLSKSGYINQSRYKLFYEYFVANIKEQDKVDSEYIDMLSAAISKLKFHFHDTKQLQEQISRIKKKLKEGKGSLNVNPNQMEVESSLYSSLQCESKDVEAIIKHFTTTSQPSFRDLYKIIQQKEKIPISALGFLLEKEQMSNAKGIVVSLLVAQTKRLSPSDYLKFCQTVQDPSEAKKIEMLFLLHFSLQQLPQQCELIANIITKVPETQLSQPCKLDFLPSGPLQKMKTTKQEKTQIQQLLSANSESNQQLFRVKIDLTTFSGDNVPFLQTIDKIIAVTSKPLEQMIESLGLEKSEEVNEVVLMRINNLMTQKYVEDVNEKALEWAIKSFNTYYSRFVKSSKEYLSSISKLPFPQFAIALKQLRLCSGSDKQLSLPQLQNYFKDDPLLTLQDQQYSTYIVHLQNKPTLQSETKRWWNHIVQLVKFFRQIDEKNYSKKQVKKIVQKFNYPTIYIIQGIYYAMKNNIMNKELITKMLSMIETNYEELEVMEKKAGELDLECYHIDTLFDYLLSIAYDETVNYISTLLKSNKLIKEEKPQKKKRGKDSGKKVVKGEETHINRILKNLVSCLQMLLNQPNRLKDLTKVTEIIDKLIHFVSVDEEGDLIICINCWMSQFSTITFNSFSEMMGKVKSLRQFYVKTYDFIKGNVKVKQIQQQFSLFSNILIRSKEYINEESYLALQHQLLSILHLIFTLQNLKDQYGIRNIEVEKIYSIFETYRKRTPEVLYFFCEDCEKNVCEGCYTFLHRNHDVNFVSKDKGVCVHEINDKPHRSKNNNPDGHHQGRVKKPERFMSKYMHGDQFEDILRFDYNNELNLEKAALVQRVIREKKDRFFERALERGVDIQIPSYMEERELGFEISQVMHGATRNPFQPQNPLQPLPFVSPPLFAAQPVQPLPQAIQDNQVQKQQNDQNEIKSESEKEIVEINTRQNINIQRLVFECESRYAEYCPNSSINMGQILKELIRDIPNTQLIGADDVDDGLVHILEKYNFDIAPTFTTELGQEKYIITRMGVSKFGGARYDLMDGDERSDRKYKMYNTSKLLIANNQKYLAISLGPSITFMQEHGLKKSFKKREKAKRYNEADNEDSYRMGKKMDVPFEILDISFCAVTPSYLGVLGANLMNIINISSTNRDFKKLVFKLPVDSEPAIRFSWLPGESNKLLIQQGNELKLVEFKEDDSTVNPQLATLKRIAAGRLVENFKVRYNSTTKSYTCFVIDTENKFHSCEFNLQSDQSEQNTLNITPPTAQPINSFIVSQKSNFGFVSFRDGSNLLLKLQSNKKVQSINLKFFKYLNNSTEGYNIFERFGSTMINLKQIYNSKQTSILGCIMRKQLNNNQTSGNFAILEISGQNLVNVVVMNDGFKTENFDVINYQDDTKQKFIIVAVQSDGCLWMKSYETKKHNSKQVQAETVSEDRFDMYHKNLSGFFKFEYGEDRIVDFKEHTKIQTIDSTVNPISKEVEISSRTPSFITGVTFKVQAIGRIKFRFLDIIYEFNIKKPREIQLPLTVKQSIMTFINKKLNIEIIYTKPLSTLIEAYGHNYERPSPIKEVYRQLILLWTFNNNYGAKNVLHYFSNSSRLDLHNVNLDQMNSAFKDASLDLNQTNFILKLQLFIQAAEQNFDSLNSRVLQEFIDKSKKFMWVDRAYIGTTIQRMYKKIFQIYKRIAYEEGKSIVYGDPYDYYTFKDTLTVQQNYKEFLSTPSHTTFDHILQTLTKMRIRRVCNLYLMFSLFPSLVWRLTSYFTIELERITSDVSKRKTGDRLVSMIVIICQYFQYLKNKKKAGEIDTFKLLELLLGSISRNKELFKELIMRSFEYLETVPLMKEIEISYGCKVFEIGSVVDESLLMLEEEQMEIRLSEPMMEEEKQSEEDQGEMRIDDDYDELIEHTERTSSVQLFVNHGEKDLKTGDCWKVLVENRDTTEIKLNYYDIVYYLITGLFQHQIIKAETNNFYIGMFYNLLNLLDMRMFKYQSKQRMVEGWIHLITKRLDHKESSPLFLVLSHFLQPDYSKLRNKASQQTPKIRDLIVEYYSKNLEQLPFHLLFNTRISSGVQKTIRLKQALSSNDITCDSLIYQLKYLGNLYLCLLTAKVDTKKFLPNIKQFVLKVYIKKKLREFKNIIILQGWLDDIHEAKYNVGFDDLKHGEIEVGVEKIMEAIKEKPETLITYIKDQPQKLDQLENLLQTDIDLDLKAQIIQIISQYYKGI